MRRALPLLVLVAGITTFGCSNVPSEPDRPAAPASAEPAVAPLLWDVPGTWTRLDAPPNGPKKATYQVPAAGNDKEPAEVDVVFFGTGSQGDAEARFKDMLGTIETDAGAPVRASFEVKGMKVETIDLPGSFKQAVGAPKKGKRPSPVQMIKAGFRLYAAVVKTGSRGNWFFKMVGPDDTVQSARSAMKTMLESAR